MFTALTLLCHSGSAGQNKQHLVTKNTAKLDRETEELHHERVTLGVGKVIQQGRQEKGLTQKDLATVSQYCLKIPCGVMYIYFFLVCSVSNAVWMPLMCFFFQADTITSSFSSPITDIILVYLIFVFGFTCSLCTP